MEFFHQAAELLSNVLCLREIQAVTGTHTASFTEASNLGWVSRYIFSYAPGLGG